MTDSVASLVAGGYSTSFLSVLLRCDCSCQNYANTDITEKPQAPTQLRECLPPFSISNNVRDFVFREHLVGVNRFSTGTVFDYPLAQLAGVAGVPAIRLSEQLQEGSRLCQTVEVRVAAIPGVFDGDNLAHFTAPRFWRSCHAGYEQKLA